MGSKKSILDVPELRSILDIKRNELSGIDVLNLSLFSSTKVFWKCENGHTFQETAKTLISRKNKCHYCSGRQVWLGENDLKTLFPSLAE